ncbi:MAG: carbon starvation protein A [Acidobacteriaceae bacterium]|nr:carbon starvation protein A [Acidobacteriaceae bacterium]
MHRVILAVLSILGAFSLGTVVANRGEPVNSLWLIAAAGCIFILGFKVYGRFLALKVALLDDRRATPAERFQDGQDFEPTNKWILLGHHFAAIAGPGPLVGPTLAAQFGYLPGVLWILVGAVLAGAVQDFIILFCSVRRDGKTLGQMARDEIGRVAGFVSLITVLLIIIVLLAVVALVVVNALKSSSWGTFTIAMTMPVAIFMGIYLRFIRPGKVLECSVIGFVLVILSILGGSAVAASPAWSHWFTLSGIALTIAIVVYGFLASALPVWLLLAPRDYLSTFIKLGVIFLLAIGILFAHPQLALPPLTRFVDGTGPIFAGKVFPFCFITIACGAISGFHSLISSGTTPKLLAKESHAWPIGYGSMLLEGFVAIMAMVAAASLQPGVYFAVNSPAGVVGNTAQAAARTISSWGFPVTASAMAELARNVGETSLFGRTGGAPSLALGMAHIFGNVLGQGGARLLGFWYHFAVMFEALFILTVIDAGTRVGRFMLQDLLRHVPGVAEKVRTRSGSIATSAVVVALWGYFLYQGVIDPLGGINSLWPLFGISNQLLSAIALCVATTVLIKMHGAKFVWVTTLPLVWLVTVTFTAGIEKIFSSDVRIGFLSHAAALEAAIAAGKVAAGKVAETHAVIFNERLDALVCGVFLTLVAIIIVESVRTWYGLLRGTRPVVTSEAKFIPSQLEPESV